MARRKRSHLLSLCLYGNVFLVFFYFASAYTDPLDVKSMEEFYGLFNQTTQCTGWKASRLIRQLDMCYNISGASLNATLMYMHEMYSPLVAHKSLKARYDLSFKECVGLTMVCQDYQLSEGSIRYRMLDSAEAPTVAPAKAPAAAPARLSIPPPTFQIPQPPSPAPAWSPPILVPAPDAPKPPSPAPALSPPILVPAPDAPKPPSPAPVLSPPILVPASDAPKPPSPAPALSPPILVLAPDAPKPPSPAPAWSPPSLDITQSIPALSPPSQAPAHRPAAAPPSIGTFSASTGIRDTWTRTHPDCQTSTQPGARPITQSGAPSSTQTGAPSSTVTGTQPRTITSIAMAPEPPVALDQNGLFDIEAQGQNPRDNSPNFERSLSVSIGLLTLLGAIVAVFAFRIQPKVHGKAGTLQWLQNWGSASMVFSDILAIFVLVYASYWSSAIFRQGIISPTVMLDLLVFFEILAICVLAKILPILVADILNYLNR